MDFNAAIFDLDGTILDSMDVWEHIDIQFLKKRNLPVPENYVTEICARSFEEAAQYTIDLFGLQETVEGIIEESIEIVQMFGRGATDINDLITNTVGACLGFFIYQLLSKLASKELCRKFQSYNINEGTELLFFIIYSFVIMVTIQPIIISTLFHLA